MMGVRVLALLALAAATASTAAGRSVSDAWLAGGSGTNSGILRLTCTRTLNHQSDLGDSWTETCRLTLEPPCEEAGTNRRVLWEDDRSWSDGLSVGPTEGRVFVRPDHGDVVVTLTSTERTVGWGRAIRVDVFLVAAAGGGGAMPTGNVRPLPSLLRWRGRDDAGVADVFHGERGLFVVLRLADAAAQVYYLDLDAATWREAASDGPIIKGTETRSASAPFLLNGQKLEVHAPTSRPAAK